MAGEIRALTDATAKPRAVQAAYAAASDSDWTARGQMELKAEAYAAAFEAFRQAVQLNAQNVEALDGLVQAAAGARRQDDVLRWLESTAAMQPTNAALRVALPAIAVVIVGYSLSFSR